MPARRSRLISDKEKELTAYHEAGHAVVGHLLPHADPVAKVTIVSRGQTGGHTRSLPEEDRHLWTLNQFKDMMAMAMGGRVSEEINFGEVTTGASNDLEQATTIAKTMVTRYGMSQKLGPRTFGKREELVFLGREISEQRDYSDTVAEIIDSEVHKLIDDAYKSAKVVLTEHKEKLVQLSKYLMDHETAEGEYLEELLGSPLQSDVKPSNTELAHGEQSPSNELRPKASRGKAPPAEPSPAS